MSTAFQPILLTSLPPPEAYSTKVFLVVIRGYVHLSVRAYVCESVLTLLDSISGMHGTYSSETHHNYLIPGPHNIDNIL